MKSFKKLLLIIGLGIVFGASVLGAVKGINYIKEHKNDVTKEEAEKENEITDEVKQVAEKKEVNVSMTDFSELVDAVEPAVVKLDCTKTITYSAFFGFYSQDYQSVSSGSGFLITESDSKVYLATNCHVIEDAEAIEVTFFDDTKAKGEIVGYDSDYDLAVVSVSISDIAEDTLNNLRIAVIGDSKSLSCGDVCLAIGNALGYGLSTTTGFVSALERDITVENVSKKLIQTDCAINPGNSGGPLLDISGRVVGITSSKFASEEVEGMCFAIPITDALPIINDLVSYVEIPENEIGYLDLSLTDITSSYSKSFNLPIGIYIREIPVNSTAYGSGLKAGDIIYEINGREVTTTSELTNRISHLRAGEQIELSVYRMQEGEPVEYKVKVTLSKRPKKEPRQERPYTQQIDPFEFFFGF